MAGFRTRTNKTTTSSCLAFGHTAGAPAAALALASLKSDETDPMTRMATNLLYELQADEATSKRLRGESGRKYAAEKNALTRMEILSEMSRLDQPDTVTMLLRMLAWDQDTRVREQIIVLLGYMRSTGRKSVPFAMPCRKSTWQVTTSAKTADSGNHVELALPRNGAVRSRDRADDRPRSGRRRAADCRGRRRAQTQLQEVPIDEVLANQVLGPLKRHAKTARSRGLRARIIRLLLRRPEINSTFCWACSRPKGPRLCAEAITEVTANLKLAK